MSRTPSRFSFGRAALLTTALMGAATLGTFPASAQQLQATSVSSQSDQVTTTTDCSKYQPGKLMADTKCEILKGQSLDSMISQVDQENACKRLIIAAAKLGKITLTAVPGPGQACKVAKDFGLS
jgi:hypothetical protein